MNKQELIKLQRLNLDLLDANRNLTSYLVDVYERNGLSHEKFSHAKSLLRQAGKALSYLNGKIDQPKGNRKKTTDKGTEPVLGFCKVDRFLKIV